MWLRIISCLFISREYNYRNVAQEVRGENVVIVCGLVARSGASRKCTPRFFNLFYFFFSIRKSLLFHAVEACRKNDETYRYDRATLLNLFLLGQWSADLLLFKNPSHGSLFFGKACLHESTSFKCKEFKKYIYE